METHPALPEPSLSWQPVPALPSAQVLVLERKADPCCSHAAVVRFPEVVLIIDPGADADLAARVSRAAREAMGQTPLPVLIVLSHAHWDHLAALPLLSFPAGAPVLVLAQEAAVPVLGQGDPRASLAFLFSADCPTIAVQVPLLPASGRTAARPWRTELAPGLALEIVADQVALPSGRNVPCDSVRVGGRDVARAFHTPGHSPDSICLQVGGLLWVGDLFLAASPAVAGVPGWDAQALVASLDTLDGLLRALPLSLCWPGHGRCLAADRAREVAASVRAQAETLRDVATLDPSRVTLLVEHAEELLSEGLALFTIIAGRLCTISFHLEALEESGAALEVLQKLDIDGLDATLHELNSFAEAFRRQHRLVVALPLKGVQAVGRIEKLFDTVRLNGLLDPVLLRRARHLLGDFVYSVRGIEPPAVARAEDLRPILAGLAEGFTRRAATARDLWDASGDEGAFRQALTRRLAAEASAVPLAIDLDLGALPPVAVDRARIEDTVHAILSEFAGAGAARVRIVARATPGGGCRIEIQPVPDRLCPCFTPRKLLFLDRGSRLGGGRVMDASTAVATRLVLACPVHETVAG
jgi:glyoxylase-like metal-dependent hydrolase (beta-lactamase superfamily II)